MDVSLPPLIGTFRVSARPGSGRLGEVFSAEGLGRHNLENHATDNQLDELPTMALASQPTKDSPGIKLGGRKGYRGYAERRLPPARPAPLILSVVLIIALAYLLNRFQTSEPTDAGRPRVITLLHPVGAGENDMARLMLAFTVDLAVVETIARLRGLDVLDGSKGKAGNDPAGAARAYGTDETLTVGLVGSPTQSRVELTRYNGETGVVMGAVAVDVPSTITDAQLAAEAVADAVRRLYDGYAYRGENVLASVNPDDFAAFVRLRYQLEKDDTSRDQQWEALSRLLARSPDFIPALVYAGEQGRVAGIDRNDERLQQQARDYSERAMTLAPDDERVLSLAFQHALDQDLTALAEALLARHAEAEPNSGRYWFNRSLFLEYRGRPVEEVLDALDRAAVLRPSPTTLLRYARKLTRAGYFRKARACLRRMEVISPGNRHSLSLRGRLELMGGDPEEAVRILGALHAGGPTPEVIADLGAAYMLLEDYVAAEEVFLQGLEAYPDTGILLMGLGECRLAQGRGDEAEIDFEKASVWFEQQSSTPETAAYRALCLARLGRNKEAVDLAMGILRDNPRHPYLLLNLARVFALAGEKAGALNCLHTAVQGGISGRWLASPAFDGLREDPRFSEIEKRGRENRLNG
ncbi:MAG: tetratricopeptide repeat protein [Acidobacteriota bacterium]|nr:tetratricopeptide repeat protein [Acidobacteriota bacterium]